MRSSDFKRLIDRLTVPTAASRAWRHDYDGEEANLDHLKKKDDKIHPRRSVSPVKMQEIVGRLQRRTTASKSWEHGYDNQAANIAYLIHQGVRLPLRRLGSAETPGVDSVRRNASIRHEQTTRSKSAGLINSKTSKGPPNEQSNRMNPVHRSSCDDNQPKRRIAFQNRSSRYRESGVVSVGPSLTKF